MAQDEFDVSDWINRLADELNILAQSATGEYRDLANQDIDEIFLLKFNLDTTNAIELLQTHPIIKRELTGTEKDTAIMIVRPDGSHRVEWNRLVNSLVRNTVKEGDGHNAAKTLHKYLTLGDKKRLPGYELIFFRGLKFEDRVDIGEGAFIISYEDIVKRGLVKVREDVPLGHDNLDYRDQDVSVFVRELTWGPGIEQQRPLFPFNIDKYSVEFKYIYEEDIGIVFDFLSIVTHQELELLSIQYRGAKFMEVISFHFLESQGSTIFGTVNNGMESGFSPRADALSEQEVSAFHEFMNNWMNAGSNLKVDLAISRLASSVSRKGRGRYWIQDRILDISIALEIMYKLGHTEITYKLSTRAGYFLGSNGEERTEIFNKVKNFYRARSYIVHGTQKRSPDFEQAFADGYDLACNTLSKLLRQGNISESDWDNLVLGDFA